MEQSTGSRQIGYQELLRTLIYADKLSISDFTESDKFAEELCDIYDNVQIRATQPYRDVLKVFNEAWYFATLAMLYDYPEQYAAEWFQEAKGRMGSLYAASLVMSMTYALLYVQNPKRESIGRVLQVIKGGEYYGKSFDYVRRRAESFARRYPEHFSNLTPKPGFTKKMFDYLTSTPPAGTAEAAEKIIEKQEQSLAELRKEVKALKRANEKLEEENVSLTHRNQLLTNANKGLSQKSKELEKTLTKAGRGIAGKGSLSVEDIGKYVGSNALDGKALETIMQLLDGLLPHATAEKEKVIALIKEKLENREG